jgi:hypothetical protein
MRAAVVALVLSSPAAAEELTFTETPDGVTITYHNELTMLGLNEETFRFESSRGPVVFLLTRTPNDSCVPMPCADLLEVVETPPGTVAVPAVVELPELGETTVRVIQFEGM